MKLPSIRQIISATGVTVRRFPLVTIDTLIGTVAAVILVDYEGTSEPTVLFNVLFAAIVGFPLLLLIAMTAEKRRWGTGATAIAQIVGIAALVLYGWSLPTAMVEGSMIHLYRLFMLTIGMTLLVTVLPFMRKGESNGFWQYNRVLVLRSITAVLYSAVLFAGLALALAALNNLFGIEVPAKRYAELWVLLAGLFTTNFFLGGIPERLDELEATTDYPAGIKIFAQYVLFPLVLVYLVILYAYLGKILLSWDWPQGWVSRLILGFAAVGILMQLLFHPIRQRVENVWIAAASRWFYVVLMPLVVMLFLALSRRISEYGLTEGRYIGYAIAGWLALIVIYFIVSKGKSIAIIPASLGLASLLISFGPWGAFSISESSQVGRLERLLTKTSILVDGKVHPAQREVSFQDTKEISSILQYLHEVHGYDRIESWFSETLHDDSQSGKVRFKDPARVAKMMGVDYMRLWEGMASDEVNLRTETDQALDIRGFEKIMKVDAYADGRTVLHMTGDEYGYALSGGLDTLTVIGVASTGVKDSLLIDVQAFARSLASTYKNVNATNIPPATMSTSIADRGMRTKLVVHHIYGTRRDSTIAIRSMSAWILFARDSAVVPAERAAP